MASSSTLARGYLLKHNRDHRKSNLLGAKYHKRWVEVTANTMLYAASQQEVLTGHIQVFAIEDMLWVKTEGDNKFQVKFTERSLKLKVVSGGKEERDQWVGALQTAMKHHAAAEEARRSGAGKLGQLQKVLLQPAAGLGRLSSAGGGHASESGSSMVLSSTGTSLDGSSHAGGRSSSAGGTTTDNSTSISTIPALHLTASSWGATEASLSGQRPPSPRTLLASARAGMALVNTLSPAGTPRTRAAAGMMAVPAQHRTPLAAQERFFLNRPDHEPNESGDEDEAGGTNVDTEGSSAAEDEVRPSPGVSAHEQTVGGQVKGGAAAAILQLPADSPRAVGAEGSGDSTPSSAHRAGLARRITPGVLLTSSRPTTPAAGTGSQQHGLPVCPQSPRADASAASRLSSTAAAAAASHAVVPARPASPVSLALPGADEVLLLDEPTADHSATHNIQAIVAAAAASPPSTSSATKPTDIYSSRLYASTTKPVTISNSSSSSRHQPSHTSMAAACSSADNSGDEVLRVHDDDFDDLSTRCLVCTARLATVAVGCGAAAGAQCAAEP